MFVRLSVTQSLTQTLGVLPFAVFLFFWGCSPRVLFIILRFFSACVSPSVGIAIYAYATYIRSITFFFFVSRFFLLLLFLLYKNSLHCAIRMCSMCMPARQ